MGVVIVFPRRRTAGEQGLRRFERRALARRRAALLAGLERAARQIEALDDALSTELRAQILQGHADLAARLSAVDPASATAAEAAALTDKAASVLEASDCFLKRFAAALAASVPRSD